MERRPFGKTGLQVTPLGLGLAALGRPGYINLGHGSDLAGATSIEALKTHSHAVLDEAWRLGIRYFDAARSYGRAEEFLGTWLRSRAVPADAVLVGSKWGYTYTAAWQVTLPAGRPHEIKEHTLPVLERQWAESNANLAPYLRLYQVHSATLESGVLQRAPVLHALAALRDQDTVIGLSISGPGQSETLWRALELEIDGRPLFGAVQATWNLLERSAGPALAAAAEAGLGVIIKEAVANGRLTPRGHSSAADGQLAHAAAEAGTTIDALALAAVLARPWAHVVLSGATTRVQLRSNVAATRVVWTPALEEALDVLAEPAAQYWQTRSNLRWN